MLIRFVVNNVFSFGQSREFTTIANSRLKTLNEHKYRFNGVEILKLSSIYGANGAGKSNLLKALRFF
ncbi:MAG: AAA family ATPase, partial [Bacteroidota bacterium]